MIPLHLYQNNKDKVIMKTMYWIFLNRFGKIVVGREISNYELDGAITILGIKLECKPKRSFKTEITPLKG